MDWLWRLAFKAMYLLGRRRFDRDFDAELDFHVEMLTDRFARLGLSRDAARRAAQRRFGSRTSVANARRDLVTFGALESAWHDLRLGARQLQRNPWFASVAVVLLALGIGANTALLMVQVSIREFLGPSPDIPLPVRDALRRQSDIFADVLAASTALSVEMTDSADANEAATTRATFVTTNFFSLLGVPAAAGRTIQDEGSAHVAVISHRMWQQAFARDPA